MEMENRQENNVKSTGISHTKFKITQFGKNGTRKVSRSCFARGKPGHVARDCRAPQSQAVTVKVVTAVAEAEGAKTDKEFGDYVG
ncbi:unnamed protein product [Haemonchus placei]|uniref:CCHC-type domain-containing protein n=1 Tax=Haemonchus placei TaxID=6290 RepID=A0A0N4WXZ5_HAEPC|nr:unnamed protein product [Haemonchus placei]